METIATKDIFGEFPKEEYFSDIEESSMKGGVKSAVAILNIAFNLSFVDLINYYRSSYRISSILDKSYFWEKKLEELNSPGIDYRDQFNINNVKKTVLTVMAIRELIKDMFIVGITPISIMNTYKFTSLTLDSKNYKDSLHTLSYILPFLSNLRKLKLFKLPVKEFPREFSIGPSNLKHLILQDIIHDTDILPKRGPFRNLQKLTTLEIKYNILDGELPEDLFMGLYSLNQLYLRSNKIKALSENIFKPLPNLTMLDIQINDIVHLPTKIFRPLQKLKELICDSNKITALQSDLFTGLSNLIVLYLGGNQIKSLPEGIFDPLVSLQILKLFGNQIKSLPEDIFDSLSQLRELDLGCNNLQSLPLGLFDHTPHLRSLNLGGNDLMVIPKGIFDPVNKLYGLDISYNSNLSQETVNWIYYRDNIVRIWSGEE